MSHAVGEFSVPALDEAERLASLVLSCVVVVVSFVPVRSSEKLSTLVDPSTPAAPVTFGPRDRQRDPIGMLGVRSLRYAYERSVGFVL